MVKHLDLFSGIGGFALAVDTVWPGSEHIFCDNDPFCAQVLKKHWPNSKIYGDIRTLTNSGSQGLQRSEQSKAFGKKARASRPVTQSFKDVDILTGGFPCQPFSQAGLRAGTEDNRYLWPEMLRVIRDFTPQWVIAENVRGLLTSEGGVVFEQVCLDLEASGYEVQAFIIPAVAVNAPHRRDRVWFIAHRAGDRRPRGGQAVANEKGYASGSKQTWKLAGGFEGSHSLDSDSAGKGRQRGESGEPTQSKKRIFRRHNSGNVKNALGFRGRGRNESRGQILERQGAQVKNAGSGWEENWLEVATRFCGVDDGLPVGLHGFKLTQAGHRTQRLKSLGNSIVPQVAIEIMKAIKNAQDSL